MPTFEMFRPQLRAGKITPQGEKLVFETEAPLDQIVLPIEVIDFLLMCNGQHTVGDIIENIYHRKSRVQFKTIFRTLTYLKNRGFLENGEELQLNDPNEPANELRFFTLGPLYELPVGKRIFNETEHPKIFYFLSLITILAAIFSLQWITQSSFQLRFFHLGGSYISGLLFFFFAASVLLSLKNFFKCLLLLFLTGRAYNFNLVIGPYAIYFQVKSDSLFLVNNRLYLFLFHSAVNLSVFPILATVYFFLPNLPYMNETLSLSLLLFLFELNPFQESEVSHLVRSMFNDDTVEKTSLYMQQKPLLSLLHPSERNRDNTLYLFFTHFTVAWSAALLYTFFSTLGYHYLTAMKTMKTASYPERLSALIVMAFAITISCIVIYNLSKVLLATLLLPIKKMAFQALRKKQSHPLQHYNSKEVMRIIEEMPLFSYFSPELLSMIVHRSDLKHYKAHTPVIIQGDEGTHLFVLLSGSLTVRKHLTNGRVKTISEIHAPSIFGEIAVIDESKRLAEVNANEECIVLEVPARMLRQIAQDSQYIRELDSFRNAIMVSQFFTSAPVFRDLPENIVHMFTAKGLIESYLPDQIIFKQGDHGDGFYLLLRGSVGVSVNGRPVSRIQQGGFFGEISMIADVPRTATIYALEHTQVLKINRDAFWEILSLNINMAMFIESVGEMRIREDIEILKGKAAKVA